ncbi:hypothetical protein [Bradyrhizobium sp. SZCCHNRI1073]|uniref:hypothetical protein n=1 Tax=Bradyrhizobium sp. SZCCHNRI1073 TaxID=3057280 RepID=UPI0029163AC8|nr:hypothetical protein [Bradyrhizobium sp. SZCCHNRI1073]
MATELQIREQLDTMLSLPLPLARLEKSLGTVKWPDQPTRINFPAGQGLTEEQREDLKARLEQLRQAMTGGNLSAAQLSKARLSLLTKLMLGYPAAGASSDEAAQSRLSFYLEAVSDIAPWALDAAIKRWVRGDVDKGNVDFAPSPGALRRLCEEELEPFEAQIFRLNRLLSAISMERAMDMTPIPPATVSNQSGQTISLPRLKVMK